MDARRVSDGKFVVIKQLNQENTAELEIVQFLNREHLRSDVRNNAVPVLDLLYAPGTERDDPVTFLVMPQLRPWDDPWLETYGEAIAFFTQMFRVRPSLLSPLPIAQEGMYQGIQVMHEQKIAHR